MWTLRLGRNLLSRLARHCNLRVFQQSPETQGKATQEPKKESAKGRPKKLVGLLDFPLSLSLPPSLSLSLSLKKGERQKEGTGTHKREVHLKGEGARLVEGTGRHPGAQGKAQRGTQAKDARKAFLKVDRRTLLWHFLPLKNGISWVYCGVRR